MQTHKKSKSVVQSIPLQDVFAEIQNSKSIRRGFKKWESLLVITYAIFLIWYVWGNNGLPTSHNF